MVELLDLILYCNKVFWSSLFEWGSVAWPVWKWSCYYICWTKASWSEWRELWLSDKVAGETFRYIFCRILPMRCVVSLLLLFRVEFVVWALILFFPSSWKFGNMMLVGLLLDYRRLIAMFFICSHAAIQIYFQQTTKHFTISCQSPSAVHDQEKPWSY